ncbi:MAG: winged helix-turn-helix transcriptional regulator [Spirochaetaceae bacterium]|nr:winged helix-turn-helix transcriptional regulator [Spirochaetaceae bacterium]
MKKQKILNLIKETPSISREDLARILQISTSSVAVYVSDLLKQNLISPDLTVAKNSQYAVVVGGVNLDIGGKSFAPLVMGDSNPGAVTLSLGGVGRNIAHNLALLGTNVAMLTAFGQDIHGDKIVSSSMELGISMEHALRPEKAFTSTYLYVANSNGDMSVAVSDMSVCEKITPDYLKNNATLLGNSQVIVMDTNIPTESVDFLAKSATVPLFCDPVSTVKAEKLIPILNKIHTLKPNRAEAELLSGIKITCKEEIQKAAEVLLEKGVQRIFLSLGGDGVYVATKEEAFFMENLPGNMVNTTGCGDAFMSALVWSFMEKADLKTSALSGLAAGSITMENAQTINPAMSVKSIRKRIDESQYKENQL